MSHLPISSPLMELCNTFVILRTPPPNLRPSLTHRAIKSTTPLESTHRLTLAESVQNETLETLEWPSVCKQVSAFTSTTMGFAAAQGCLLPLGRSPEESRRLLDQTAAAMALSQPLDFSGIEDVLQIVKNSVSGELVTISELCTVKRTLRSATELFGQLEELASRDDDSCERYNCLTAPLATELRKERKGKLSLNDEKREEIRRIWFLTKSHQFW